MRDPHWSPNLAVMEESNPNGPLLEAVRDVIRVHHGAVRQAGGAFMRAVQSVAPSLGPQSVSLVHQYDAFARRLAETFVDLEVRLAGTLEEALEEGRADAMTSLAPAARDATQALAAHHFELSMLELSFPWLAEALREPVQAFASEVNACITAWREVLRGPLAPWLAAPVARG